METQIDNKTVFGRMVEQVTSAICVTGVNVKLNYNEKNNLIKYHCRNKDSIHMRFDEAERMYVILHHSVKKDNITVRYVGESLMSATFNFTMQVRNAHDNV